MGVEWDILMGYSNGILVNTCALRNFRHREFLTIFTGELSRTGPWRPHSDESVINYRRVMEIKRKKHVSFENCCGKNIHPPAILFGFLVPGLRGD